MQKHADYSETSGRIRFAPSMSTSLNAWRTNEISLENRSAPNRRESVRERYFAFEIQNAFPGRPTISKRIRFSGSARSPSRATTTLLLYYCEIVNKPNRMTLRLCRSASIGPGRARCGTPVFNYICSDRSPTPRPTARRLPPDACVGRVVSASCTA